MIFVTVGTNEAPFDRLVREAARLAEAEDVLVQYGASVERPEGAACVEFLPYDQMVDTIRRASVVVAHAGVGSVMTALANGKRPFVVPRQRRYGEAVDDHQVSFARAAAANGLVELVEEADALVAAITSTPAFGGVELEPSRRLIGELRAYVAAHAGPPAASDQ